MTGRHVHREWQVCAHMNGQCCVVCHTEDYPNATPAERLAYMDRLITGEQPVVAPSAASDTGAAHGRRAVVLQHVMQARARLDAALRLMPPPVDPSATLGPC